MTPSSLIRAETVEIDSDGVAVPAYCATPSREGAFPAVVVIQEIFGVNSHIREVTERIALEGYVAIAPHIYHRQIPGFEVGYGQEDMALGRQYKDGTNADELLADIRGAIAYVHSKDHVKTSGVGCIGFCFGGHVAYLGSILPEVIATASFYGGGIATFTPGGGSPTIALTPKISGTLYGFFGTEDPLIPNEEVDQIEATLKENNIDHRIFRYEGASHGFFCDQRGSYHPEAAADAWEQVKQLFADKL